MPYLEKQAKKIKPLSRTFKVVEIKVTSDSGFLSYFAKLSPSSSSAELSLALFEFSPTPLQVPKHL